MDLARNQANPVTTFGELPIGARFTFAWMTLAGAFCFCQKTGEHEYRHGPTYRYCESDTCVTPISDPVKLAIAKIRLQHHLPTEIS